MRTPGLRDATDSTSFILPVNAPAPLLSVLAVSASLIQAALRIYKAIGSVKQNFSGARRSRAERL